MARSYIDEHNGADDSALSTTCFGGLRETLLPVSKDACSSAAQYSLATTTPSVVWRNSGQSGFGSLRYLWAQALA